MYKLYSLKYISLAFINAEVVFKSGGSEIIFFISSIIVSESKLSHLKESSGYISSIFGHPL